jgi:hypothetical protein
MDDRVLADLGPALDSLGKLAERGLITEGGDDPFTGSPVAYHLSCNRFRREAPNSTRPKPQNDTPSVDVAMSCSRANSSDAVEVPSGLSPAK